MRRCAGRSAPLCGEGQGVGLSSARASASASDTGGIDGEGALQGRAREAAVEIGAEGGLRRVHRERGDVPRLLRLPARQEGRPLTSVEPISHRHGDGARLANVRFCKPAALLPVQGLFLVALAIVTAAEGSPVKILDLIADGFEGMLGGLVEGAAGAQRLGR